jgi:hypothetical protein
MNLKQLGKFGRYFVKPHLEPNCCCLWCVNRNDVINIHNEIKEFPLGRKSISIYCECTSLRLDQTPRHFDGCKQRLHSIDGASINDSKTSIWSGWVLPNDDRVDHVKNSTSQLTMNVQRLNKTGIFRFRQSIFWIWQTGKEILGAKVTFFGFESELAYD